MEKHSRQTINSLTFMVAECDQVHPVTPFYQFDIETKALGSNIPHRT